MTEPTMRPGDEELWVRCFAAALTGMTARGGQPQPEEIARVCGEIADGALGEIRRRRGSSGVVMRDRPEGAS
jgi:hypothetical protein